MHILVLGLNPTWQKTLCFAEFVPGQVNRARGLNAAPGGKGVHTSRAVKAAGGRVTLAQFVGRGHTGRVLCRTLEHAGIKHLSVPVAGDTRTCTTLLSERDSSMTELIEPSPMVEPRHVDRLLALITDELPSVDGVAISGTVPQGVPSDFYAQVIAAARDTAVVVFDGYVAPEAALRAGPHVVKINVHELTELMDQADVSRAAASFLETYPVGCLALTAGPAQARVFGRDSAWTLSLPALPLARNPLGAGDCATGTLVCALLSRMGEAAGSAGPGDYLQRHIGQIVVPAFAEALAAASASCLELRPAVYQASDAEALLGRITCRRDD